MAKTQPQKKEYPPRTGTFTIKTIVGTGNSADYWRIADDLVRGSRLFRSLCRKIMDARRSGGINRRYKDYFKGLYKSVIKEFKAFEIEANRLLKSQNAIIKRQERTISEMKVSKEKLLNKMRFYYWTIRKVNTKNKRLISQNARVKRAEAFFTKDYSWHSDSKLEYRKIEIMIRGIVGFNEVVNSNETSYYEFLFLSMGYQLDAFSKSQAVKRFGTQLTKHFTRETNKLIKQGYIRRFERKAYFYVTEEGRIRFNYLLKKVYTRDFATYWDNIFDERIKKNNYGNDNG